MPFLPDNELHLIFRQLFQEAYLLLTSSIYNNSESHI